jgi:hypothetical protein
MKFDLYKVFLLLLIICVSRGLKQEEEEAETIFTNKFDPSHQINNDSYSTELAKYFLKLASFGYCPVEYILNNKCCSDLLSQDGWTVLEKSKLTFDEFTYVILENTKSKKIVITFSGTKNLLQLFKEYILQTGEAYIDKSYMKIMKYFNEIYTDLKVEILKIFNEKFSFESHYKEYQFIFVGHSLGGAMANIMALDLVLSNSLKVVNNYSPVLITYGQPRTGNDIFANMSMKNIPIVFRIVRQGDFIANYPRCLQESFLDITCSTLLPDGKFNKDFILNNETDQALELQNYYNWHIGGLKLYSRIMDEFLDCGSEFGENHPNLKCDLTSSLDLTLHTRYFGSKVSHLCLNN